MAVQGEERVLQIIVKSKEEPVDGFYTVTVDIPAFKSQYPTKLTRIPENIGKAMVVGSAYRVVLKRGNLKKGKDGSIDWHYYWDWVRPATKEEQAQQPGFVAPAAPAPTGTLRAEPPIVVSGDSREQSIQRQVALKVAAEVIAACCQPGTPYDGPIAATLKAYRQFAAALEGTAQAKEQEAQGG